MKGRGVCRTNGSKFMREPVKGDHGFAAMSAEKERLNGLGVAIVDDGPEAEPADPTAHLAMDEREGVVSFGLKDRETLLGCDTDVGFEHDPLHSTDCRIFSIPDATGIRILLGAGARPAMQIQRNVTNSWSFRCCGNVTQNRRSLVPQDKSVQANWLRQNSD
jgi:hypothetical protein